MISDIFYLTKLWANTQKKGDFMSVLPYIVFVLILGAAILIFIAQKGGQNNDLITQAGDEAQKILG